MVRSFEFLLGKAAQIVMDDADGNANAALCHARGVAANGTAIDADDLTKWTFVFLLPKGYVSIAYTGHFEQPIYHHEMWLGDQPITPPLDKSLKDAVGILRGAGYSDPFAQVDLRKPLHPSITEPAYIFGLGHPVSRVVGIGANSGTVQTT